ncbi:hypothetical protein NDU88_005947 [Pleurodeles waltl]|uniref:Uncharacterized protein n=1 Tax=Pleurodeles waltl TaxID=8319 RepID=A0AAV7QM63_PLEWA|nr:hypothetical protein NDU88_005947 [Pleurodeles waltl]
MLVVRCSGNAPAGEMCDIHLHIPVPVLARLSLSALHDHPTRTCTIVSDRSSILQPGEPRVAQIPWREEQAEPSAAGRCASTGGQRKRADASEGWCGSAGFVPNDATILWEQRPGPSKFQRGKDRRHAGGEPKGELLLQGTRAAVLQGGDLWREEECVLDFDEGSVEEGELVDDREEEDWWAQGGSGPANALSQSLQRSRKVQPAVERVVDGAHIDRRKAQERPPSLTAGEESGRAQGICCG